MTSVSEEAGRSHQQSARIDNKFTLTKPLGAVDVDVTPGRCKSAGCTGRRRQNTVGKSECSAQPLWRSSPGASMSVYQTAFWEGYVTALWRTYSDESRKFLHHHQHQTINNNKVSTSSSSSSIKKDLHHHKKFLQHQKKVSLSLS